MKQFSLCALLMLSMFGVGCGVLPASTPSLGEASDFTPPVGRGENPPPESAGERRLLLATSSDGVTFAPTGEILTDQGNVPDAVVDAAGTLYVYYIGQGIEPGETTAVAISRDNGETWTYKFLTYTNWPTKKNPSDPDVVLLDDGTFRMYFTGDTKARRLGILYADSDDGLNFTYKGESLTPSYSVIDSTTFFFDDEWHMYVLDEKRPEQYHATSQDGVTFTIAEKSPVILAAGGGGYIGSNPLIENGVVRLFGFTHANRDIRSFASQDGVIWTAESGVRLAPTEEALHGGGYLQDSTVVRLNDGEYLLVYVADIAME